MISSQYFRTPNQRERFLIERLLLGVDRGRTEYRAQCRQSLVWVLDKNGSLKFKVPNELQFQDLENGLVSEGEFIDVDGETAHILLHVQKGLIHELEIYREDGLPLLCFPDATQVEVFDDRAYQIRGKEAFRDMFAEEQDLVKKLLAPPFPGRDLLCKHINNTKVRICDHNGSLEFLSYSNTSYIISKCKYIKYPIPIRGIYEDIDGVDVNILLHVCDDEVKEIEFYRGDNTKVQRRHNIDKLQVIINI